MKRGLMAIIVVAVACGLASAAELPSVLLESGRYQETTVKDPDAAVKIYEQIIAEAEANRPYVAEAHYRLGTIYLKKGDKERGIAELKKVVEQYPDQAAFAGTAKVLLAKEGQSADGTASGKPQVVSTVPAALSNDVDPGLKDIRVTFDREMAGESWSWTRISRDTFPRTAGRPFYDAQRRTCTLPVALEPGKVYCAGINYSRYTGFQSASGEIAQWYIILFATKDKDGNPTPLPDDLVQRAKEVNARHVAAPPVGGPTADELTREGWQLWSQGKLAESEQKFRESLEKMPGSANAWNGLGWAQFNQGKPNDAKQSFLKCIELDSKAAAAYNGLGYIAKLEGDTEGAIGYWENAIAANPSATASLSGLANTYVEIGQPGKAVTYYEMWLKAEPDNADAKDGLAKTKAAKP